MLLQVISTDSANRVRGWHGQSYEPKWQSALVASASQHVSKRSDGPTPTAPAKSAAHASLAFIGSIASQGVSTVDHASLVRRLEQHMQVGAFNQKKMATILCLPSPAKLSLWMGRGEHRLPSAAATAAIDTVVATYLNNLN